MRSIPRNLPILRELLGLSAQVRAQARAGQRFFGDFRCQKSDLLKKSRAARATKTTMTSKNRDFATDDSKIEDPAKMTYSIPDFVSRNATNLPIYCPILREFLTNHQ